MNIAQLEHVLRAAAAITGTDRFVVIGSQSILGTIADPPTDLTQSVEVDLAPLSCPSDADLIDGSIGELSPFHSTFGYYAHGVSIESATLPDGWESRLKALCTPLTGGATALCLEPTDLAVAKLVAGRDKDVAFITVLVRHGLVTIDGIRSRLRDTRLAEPLRAATEARLRRIEQSYLE